MRDLDKQPYSPDEQRVAQFFFDAGLGGGDDPIGFIIASHVSLAADRNEAREEASDLQALFDRQWAADQRAIKRWQAAHPGNDFTWPDRADMVVWLMEQHGALAKPTEAMLGAMALVLVDWLGRAPAHAMLEEAYKAAVAKAGNDIGGL